MERREGEQDFHKHDPQQGGADEPDVHAVPGVPEVDRPPHVPEVPEVPEVDHPAEVPESPQALMSSSARLAAVRKKREYWTNEEHIKFLDALARHGRDWKAVERYVHTKTAVQIRSHAQKYFLRLEKRKELPQPMDMSPPHLRRPRRLHPNIANHLPELLSPQNTESLQAGATSNPQYGALPPHQQNTLAWSPPNSIRRTPQMDMSCQGKLYQQLQQGSPRHIAIQPKPDLLYPPVPTMTSPSQFSHIALGFESSPDPPSPNDQSTFRHRTSHFGDVNDERYPMVSQPMWSTPTMCPYRTSATHSNLYYRPATTVPYHGSPTIAVSCVSTPNTYSLPPPQFQQTHTQERWNPANHYSGPHPIPHTKMPTYPFSGHFQNPDGLLSTSNVPVEYLPNLGRSIQRRISTPHSDDHRLPLKNDELIYRTMAKRIAELEEREKELVEGRQPSVSSGNEADEEQSSAGSDEQWRCALNSENHNVEPLISRLWNAGSMVKKAQEGVPIIFS